MSLLPPPARRPSRLRAPAACRLNRSEQRWKRPVREGEGEGEGEGSFLGTIRLFSKPASVINQGAIGFETLCDSSSSSSAFRFYTTRGEPTRPQRQGMVVSFGIGSPSKHRSFPRKRESSPSAAHFQWLAEWIPASAGMTAPGNARSPQMTPAPGRGSGRIVRSKAAASAGYVDLKERVAG